MKILYKKIVAISILTSFFGTNWCLAQDYPQQFSSDTEAQLEQILADSEIQQPEEKTAKTTLKAGENFAIEIDEDLDSQNLRQGDEVSAKLLFPIEVNNQIIIPEGSTVKGKVTKIAQAGGWYKNAQVEIEFSQIDGQDDYKLPIIAQIKTKDNSGKLLGGGGFERLGKVFSSLSTISLGGAIAGLGVGLVTSYALVGAVIGFGIGAVIASGWLFFQKGKPILIPSGTKLIITLQNDVAVGGFEL